MTRDRSFDANAVGLRSRRAARSSDVTSFGHSSPTTRMLRARTTPGTLVLGRAGSRARPRGVLGGASRDARVERRTRPLVDARVDDARAAMTSQLGKVLPFFFFFFFFRLKAWRRKWLPVVPCQSQCTTCTTPRAFHVRRVYSDAARGGRDARRMTRRPVVRTRTRSVSGLVAPRGRPTSRRSATPRRRRAARAAAPGTHVRGRAGSRAEAKAAFARRDARRATPGGTSYAPSWMVVDDARGG